MPLNFDIQQGGAKGDFCRRHTLSLLPVVLENNEELGCTIPILLIIFDILRKKNDLIFGIA